tara:strand:+ start:407 stop:625 length:219 start_codon:yes stop_codon:yes gene_type:complete
MIISLNVLLKILSAIKSELNSPKKCRIINLLNNPTSSIDVNNAADRILRKIKNIIKNQRIFFLFLLKKDILK